MASPNVVEALVERLRTRTGGGADAAPVAVLWPDEARAWEPIVPLIRSSLPIVTLGAWGPEQLRGPAYWIRCVVDGSLRDERLPAGPPIVYLPGIARTDIRAVEDAPESLKPLAELQYRGTIFSQANGRDMTITAFLESGSHGLGVTVADDQATREALLRARTVLATTAVEDLRRAAPLRAAFFNELLSPDLDRDVLRWLDDRAAFEASLTEEERSAFAARVQERFGGSLADGEIALASQLGLRGGPWSKVWQRYAEAPARYPRVEERLAAARPERPGTGSTLFEGAWGNWPQDNDQDEDRLRADLLRLKDAGASACRERLSRLASEHAGRRDWVWAALGRAPLALAVEHLARLAELTVRVHAPESVEDATRAYAADGWRVDDAVVRALESVRTEADRTAVSAAIRPAYEPWLDEAARRFQEVVGLAADAYRSSPLPEWPAGTALVFFDGLRLDIAHRLVEALRREDRQVAIEPRLTALPTITPTAKPAVSPVAGALGPGRFFAPASREGGADLAVAGLRALLDEAGYQVLAQDETGDPGGRAWTELGDLDEIGHLQPADLPERAAREVERLAERIGILLEAGWRQVVVLTDHGWLYLPGGLPKVDLPVSVTKDDRGRKGRTARLAEGAQAPGTTVPWHWDPDVRMAVAPGISTFIAGAVYEHGGVSPQECVTPVVTVRAAASAAGPIAIAVRWTGLRARIAVTGAPAGATADVRRKAGDEGTSLIGGAKPVPAEGELSALVPDEDAEGTSVFVVVHAADGRPLGQSSTTVGGTD